MEKEYRVLVLPRSQNNDMDDTLIWMKSLRSRSRKETGGNQELKRLIISKQNLLLHNSQRYLPPFS